MNRNNTLFGGIACLGTGCLTCVLVLGLVIALRFNRNSPRLAAYRHNMDGNAYYSQGAYKRAAAEYSEMIRLQPRKHDGYFLRAMAYYKLGAFDKSIADNTAVLGMNEPTQVIEIAHYNRGLDYEAKRDHANAIPDFSKAIELNPNNTDALINRADARRLTGDAPGCAADITDAMRRKPPTHGEYFIRGLALLDMHKFDRAASDFSHAATMNPANGVYLGDLAWANYMAGDLGAAMLNGRKAIAGGPGVAMYRLNLALCYAVQNDWTNASEQYRTGCTQASQADIKGALQDIADAKRRYSSAAVTLGKAEALLAGVKQSRGAAK